MVEKTVADKTSVSLGNRKAVIEEIRTKEDRSASNVIRRAIDFYYLMNYVPEVEPDAGEVEEMERASSEIKAGKFSTLEALAQKHGLESKIQQKSRKATR